MLHRIASILQTCDTDRPLLPPTELFSEGWLLRLTLDWFAQHTGIKAPVRFFEGSRWFSEARLPSRFLPRSRRDHLAEGWTHADAVVGHFTVSEGSKARLELAPDAQQFVIAEAKLFSPLSPGTTRAPAFDQAARNVACMAEVLRRARRRPTSMAHLAFYVLLPESQLADGAIRRLLSPDSLAAKVHARVASYSDPDMDTWREAWFEPTLAAAEIRPVPWEETQQIIASQDPIFASELKAFYNSCLHHNGPPDRAAT